MSYGPLFDHHFSKYQKLSSCNAQFLAVHTYFNSDIPTEEGERPTIEVRPISPVNTTDKTSVPIEVTTVQGSSRLHQVFLTAQTRTGPSKNVLEVKDCRDATDRTSVSFDYDGQIPSELESGIDTYEKQKVGIWAVDIMGNLGRFKILDLVNRKVKKPIYIFPDSLHSLGMKDMVFSHDGQVLLAGLPWEGGPIEIWSVTKRRRTHTLSVEEDRSNAIIAFSSDGRILATADKQDGVVDLWNVSSGNRIRTVSHDSLSSVVLSPDGRWLATAGRSDGLVKVWSVSNGAHVHTITRPYIFPVSLTFSPDGRFLTTAQSGNAGKTTLWNVRTGQLMATLSGGYPIAFSPDSKVLVSDGSEMVRITGDNPWVYNEKSGIQLWDTEAGQRLAFLEGSPPFSFSPDGQWLVSMSASISRSFVMSDVIPNSTQVVKTYGSRLITVWDLSTRTVVKTFPLMARARELSFSPNGERLASWYSTGYDEGVSIWSLSDNDQGAEGSTLGDLFTAFTAGKPVVSTQLAQNTPNPFNSQTIISYALPAPHWTRLEVFALTGQRVTILHQGVQQAGVHRVPWDGTNDVGHAVASGVYLYRLVTDGESLTRKLILLR